MGSIVNDEEEHGGYPFSPIVLDTTLHDLLSQDGDQPVKETLCNAKPNSDPSYLAIPTNNKYLITSAQLSSGEDLAHLQLENTSFLLSFWAGPMEVNLVGSEGWSKDNSLSAKAMDQKARTSFGVLSKEQRPKVRTFANADDFVENYGKDNTCRWGFAVDFSEQVPSYIHAEQHYKLNSKRWLAECSLRSANDQIIDCECACPTHTTKQDLWYYVSACSDCETAIENEISRVRKILQDRESPFVFKLTQCLGSAGTSLIRTKDDKAKLVEYATKILKESLPRLTLENAHIYPTAFVVSDFIPGKTMALNFYIRKDGLPHLLGICHQLSTRGGEGGRQQTALTWDHQEDLEKKYRDVLIEIGQVLNKEGYYGPAGADIMETEDGTQFVIDLNVRTATSLVLGLLRGHCEKRKYNACLVFECLLLVVSREELYKKFAKEFEEGRIILLGSTRLGGKDMWAYPVVLTGEDQDSVKALSGRILENEASGSEEAEDAGGG